MCEMCLTNDTFRLTNLEHDNKMLKEKVDALEIALSYYRSKDSIQTATKKHFPNESYGKIDNIKLLKGLSPIDYIPDDERCFMFTQTFDPAKFHVLNNRVSQRDYIKQVYEVVLYNQPMVQGCYELHKSGIVHSHFIVLEKVDLDVLKSYFTKNKDNEHCINYQLKTYKEAFDYISKQLSKDSDNFYNYFERKKCLKNSFENLPENV